MWGTGLGGGVGKNDVIVGIIIALNSDILTSGIEFLNFVLNINVF